MLTGEPNDNGTDSVNGVKTSGKVKSKNQLRRLKAKQKKAEQSVTPTPVRPTNCALRESVSSSTRLSGAEWRRQVRGQGGGRGCAYEC